MRGSSRKNRFGVLCPTLSLGLRVGGILIAVGRLVPIPYIKAVRMVKDPRLYKKAFLTLKIQFVMV